MWAGLGDRGKIRERLLERHAPAIAKKIAPAADANPRTEPDSAETRNSELNQRQVIDYLVHQFAELTKLPTAQIYADEPVENYGLDSIMITTFAQMLEHDLGELSKTLLFEYPTIEALAGYLLKSHAAALSELFRPVAAPVQPELRPAVKSHRFLFPSTTEAPAASERMEKPSVTSSEDIAIIGVFGRYPQADDLDEFWANLVAGKDSIEEVPADRWNYRDHYDPDAGKPGKTTNKWGGFLKDVDRFDPLFFNISPAEAQFMDPQERLFLETVWKTVEDAGYTKTALNECKVGVFVGVMYGQYQLFGVEERLEGEPDFAKLIVRYDRQSRLLLLQLAWPQPGS